MNESAEKMTSCERVMRSLLHKETDRLPRDFDAEASLVEALCSRLDMPNLEELRRYFAVDMHKVSVGYACPYTDGRNIYGISMHSSSSGATSNVATHPLANARTVEDVESYTWPDADWADLEAAKGELVWARNKELFTVCSSWGSVFGEAYRLMGMDNFMIALHESPGVAHAIVSKLMDFYLEVDRRLFTHCAGLIDMAFYGNDMGTQQSLLFRREAFQEFFQEPLRRLVEQANRFGLKTMMHSCGAISEVIPDIISIGFDSLDPVQYTATGMNPKGLKDFYGDKITFHGCISAQKVLPHGTQQDVRAHVIEVCEIMKPGGGYIFTSDQSITSDTPVDNVLEMFRAIDEMGY